MRRADALKRRALSPGPEQADLAIVAPVSLQAFENLLAVM
jgi:hypothetical protein